MTHDGFSSEGRVHSVHQVLVSRSSPSGGLTYSWCPFLSVTLEKETQMCRGVVGQPSLPQLGVWSRKLSRGMTLQSTGISSTLCTLSHFFYLILDLFRLTRYFSVQKRDKSIVSGFLRCHSEISHFPLHWTVSTQGSGYSPSWWISGGFSTGSNPMDCEENLPTTVWLVLYIPQNNNIKTLKFWCLVHRKKKKKN